MTSINELPNETLDHILNHFVFTYKPWQSTLQVCKLWRDIVSVYAPTIREQELKAALNSLKDRISLYTNSHMDLLVEERAKGLYDAFFELAHIRWTFFSGQLLKSDFNAFFSPLVMAYSNALSTYNSLPLKHLLGTLIRRLHGELLILLCSTFLRDCKDADPHTAAMGLRQMTDFSLKKAVVFREYAFDGIRENLNRNEFECRSAALLNLSKLIHIDEFWTQAKEQNVLHDVVPDELIPSYAILAAEMKMARRIEVVAKYFSVKQLVDSYHTWTLWQRNAVLQLISRNFNSVIDASEHAALMELLMARFSVMCSNRELIATNCGEFFDMVDALGHFCVTNLGEELLGIRLLKTLAETMVLLQHDYPHLPEIVHGFLVKCRQLILFMKYDSNSDPDLVENFFPLWCDDSALAKRKLWFVRHLACQQNVTSVKFELEQFLQCEENSTVKQLAQDILEGVKLVTN